MMDYTGLELQDGQIRLITLCPVPAGEDPDTAPIRCTMTVRSQPLPTDGKHQQSASSSPTTYFSFDHCVTKPPPETFVAELRQELAPLFVAIQQRKSSWSLRLANKLRKLFSRTPREHSLAFPVHNFTRLLSPEDKRRLMTDGRGGAGRRIWGPEGDIIERDEDAFGYTLLIGNRSPPFSHTGVLAPDDLNPFLRPQLQNFDPDRFIERATQGLQPGTYVAMSYAWGPPEPRARIIVNGKTVLVRANLEAGLRQFRSMEHFLMGKIWIDALCINQADDAEKAKQIPMMASIYSNAANVIVWLGPEEPGSDLAISVLEQVSTEYRTEYLEALDKSDPLTATTWRTMAQVRMETNYITFRKVFLDLIGGPGALPDFVDSAVDLYNFFDRPYWRRLWIIQELCMGRAGMPMVCGRRVTQWRYIRDGALIFTAVLDILREVTAESIMRQSPTAMVREHSLFHVAQIAQLEITGHRLQLPEVPPGEVPILAPTLYEHGPLLGTPIRRAITLAAQSSCWQQHDRIYGMLSIPGLPDLDIKVDYSKDVVDVFTEFTAACVRHGSLDFFAILDGGYMSRHDEHGNAQRGPKPSWVPDYGAKLKRRIGVIDGDWAAGGYVPVSQRHPKVVDQVFLVCNGKVVDMVDGVGAMSRADIESGAMTDFTDDDPLPRIVQPTGPGATAKGGGEAVIHDVLVGGCDLNGAEAPQSFSCLYSAFPVDEPPKHSTFYRNWHFLRSSADFLVNGRPLSAYFTHLAQVPSDGKPAHGLRQECTSASTTPAPTSYPTISGEPSLGEPSSGEPPSSSVETAAARQAMEARTKMRRLVMTSSGLLGLAPVLTQPGDAVLAIVGHGKPVIARKLLTDDGDIIWYLIGEAYIHSMMRAQKMPISTKHWHWRETEETLRGTGPIVFV